MGMGRNANGEWVATNNTCTNCGHRMPLPEMNRKYCPECGTFCRGPGKQKRAEIEKAKNKCPKCGCSNTKDANFCVVCGAKLS